MRNTIDASKLDLNETIVSIRRVAKTVKGGRNMRFSVTAVSYTHLDVYKRQII